jgi:hypothetical protein
MYDICWIYALSILSCRTTDTSIIIKIIPNIARNYFGASGWCQLNESGDRNSSNYQIWGFGKQDHIFNSHIYGLYDSITNSVTWTELQSQNEHLRINPSDINILIYEKMSLMEKEVREMRTETLIIKKYTRPPSFLNKISDLILDNIIGLVIGLILGFLIRGF